MTGRIRFSSFNVFEDDQQWLFATKGHIAEMLAFIGGFEKWSVLPEDCRREVVKYVGYESRCNLGVCSRQDYETVKKTSIHVDSVEIVESSIRGWHKVTVRVQFDRENHFTQFFTQIGREPRSDHPPSDCHKKATHFAEKWIKKGKFEINRIDFRMTKFPIKTSQIKSLPQCKNAHFFIDDLDSLNWFIGKLPEQLDYLTIHYTGNREPFATPSHILNAPQVMQAARLYIGGRVEITNDQLSKLEAKELKFKPVDVPVQGLKQYIQNWMNGKGADGFKVLRMRVDDRNFDSEALLDGLEYWIWDEEFRAEAPELVRFFRRKGGGPCFQFQSRCVPYESLTLNLGEDVVRLVATGFRGERDGEPFQDYILPSF